MAFTLLSWLFPNTCQLCGEPGDLTICPACRTRLERVPRPVCLYCGSPVAGEQEDPMHCAACHAKPRPFTFARSALYETPETLGLAHDLKYHRATHLARPLARIMAELWDCTPQLRQRQDWVVAPVPIAGRKLFSRGYNQAEELAEELCRLRGLPMLQPLRRVETGVRSQTKLSAAERMKNAYRAYSLQPAYASGKKALPPHIILLDDVYTTGATARACAHALRRGGAQTVAALTLLRVR